LIDGTPDTVETCNFTIRATDDASVASCSDPALSITINAVVPTITTTTLPGGVQDFAYSSEVVVSGGALPLAFDISAGALCTGLELGAATGVISGTPTLAETCNFTVRVTDDNAATDTQALSVIVASSVGDLAGVVTPGITNGTVSMGFAGLPYTDTCTATIYEGEAVATTASSTSGGATRTVSFSGLTASTDYTAVLTCDSPSGEPSIAFTTKPTAAGNATYSIVLKPNAILTTADKVRVTYDTVPSTGAASSADTSCAAGCTVDLTLARGTVYVIYHRWLTSGSATIATSANRYVAVH